MRRSASSFPSGSTMSLHKDRLECYEADRQELEYQTRKAALRGLAPPQAPSRMPDGCAEAKRHESERQQTTANATE